MASMQKIIAEMELLLFKLHKGFESLLTCVVLKKTLPDAKKN